MQGCEIAKMPKYAINIPPSIMPDILLLESMANKTAMGKNNKWINRKKKTENATTPIKELKELKAHSSTAPPHKAAINNPSSVVAVDDAIIIKFLARLMRFIGVKMKIAAPYAI